LVTLSALLTTTSNFVAEIAADERPTEAAALVTAVSTAFAILTATEEAAELAPEVVKEEALEAAAAFERISMSTIVATVDSTLAWL
jgi:hypothetical protein